MDLAAPGYKSPMEYVAISIIVLVLFGVLAVLAVSRMRARETDRAIRHEKLEAVADGHREMVDAHAVSIEELRPKAEAHRRTAEHHARLADELEARIAREERHAQFHEERAQATEQEREQV
ncbi:MAG: hypothetical protein QOK16_2352 [Solirubrobacteraceae bacterium]|nr:hypothetical protein [Solirubrobacteraceae bacterium]MEA2182905.1 hypothetical protein [Solirubrobacteraceae bacterium]MEA2187341.1 hypothetical protein [Solirubrobacteraceae bacterium]